MSPGTGPRQRLPAGWRAARYRRAFRHGGHTPPHCRGHALQAAFRSGQLIWKEQQNFLDNQRQVDRQVREAATASAAIESLKVLPHAEKISYRRDGNEIVFVFVIAIDVSGSLIVNEDDFLDPDSPRFKDRTFQGAVCRTEEDFEVAEAYIDRWIDIDVDDAIAKAGARLEQEPTPDLATAPLKPDQRELLVKAAKKAYSMVQELIHRGYPAEDVEYKQPQDDLGRLVGTTARSLARSPAAGPAGRCPGLR